MSCGYLEDPQYGRVVLTGTNVGATSTYSCNTGFILLEDEVRRCQANGKWSGRVPICQRKCLTAYYQLTLQVVNYIHTNKLPEVVSCCYKSSSSLIGTSVKGVEQVE